MEISSDTIGNPLEKVWTTLGSSELILEIKTASDTIGNPLEKVWTTLGSSELILEIKIAR
jgi:hypothetical protein